MFPLIVLSSSAVKRKGRTMTSPARRSSGRLWGGVAALSGRRCGVGGRARTGAGGFVRGRWGTADERRSKPL